MAVFFEINFKPAAIGAELPTAGLITMSSPVQAKPWSFGRFAKYITILLLVFVTAYIAWIYWLFKGGVFSTSRFDHSAWHAKPTNETEMTCFRGGMANDIKHRVLKAGVSHAAVKDLLGEPDVVKPVGFEYNLGMCNGLGIDFDSLNVYFNPSGELTGAVIVQH